MNGSLLQAVAFTLVHKGALGLRKAFKAVKSLPDLCFK